MASLNKIQEYEDDSFHLILAARKGEISILENAYNKKEFPHQKKAKNMLQKKRNYRESQEIANQAARWQQFETLKWLNTKGIKCHDKMLNYVIRKGNIPMAEYLLSQGCELHSNCNLATSVAFCGDLEMLKWLKLHAQLPEISFYGDIIANGHLHVLKWLYEHDSVMFSPCRPNCYNNFADKACIEGQLSILKWFAEINLFPDHVYINEAAKLGHLEVLQFLATLNLFADSQGAFLARWNGKNEVVEWLKTIGIIA